MTYKRIVGARVAIDRGFESGENGDVCTRISGSCLWQIRGCVHLHSLSNFLFKGLWSTGKSAICSSIPLAGRSGNCTLDSAGCDQGPGLCPCCGVSSSSWAVSKLSKINFGTANRCDKTCCDAWKMSTSSILRSGLANGSHETDGGRHSASLLRSSASDRCAPSVD